MIWCKFTRTFTIAQVCMSACCVCRLYLNEKLPMGQGCFTENFENSVCMLFACVRGGLREGGRDRECVK